MGDVMAGFFLVFTGLVCLIFLLASIRTNLCFVGILTTLVVAFGLLTGAYWLLAEDYQGNAARATDLIVVSSPKVFDLSIRPPPMVTNDSNGIFSCRYLGCWSCPLCYMHVWLVHLPRHRFGNCRLPAVAARGGPVPGHQTQGKGGSSLSLKD